jgi:hypothetical protein
MMGEELTVRARLDTSALEEKEAEWKLRLRALNNDVARTRTELKRTSIYASVVVGSVMSVLNVLVSTLPEPLRLVGTAAIGAVSSVVQAIMASALAMSAAGAANPLFLVQAAVAWIGVEIAVFGLFAAIGAQQQLDADVSRMQSQMRSMGSSLQGILGALGGY